jgi:MFS transporter, DHA2 family, methylenomycin A resistance protein
VTRGIQPRSTTEPAAGRRDHAQPTDTTRNSKIALLSACLGFFVIQLDVTIVNVALPAIEREIGGSLAGLTAGFITAGQRGWLSVVPAVLFAVGLVTGWLFVRAERRRASPMLPLGLFRSRSLSGATGVGVIFNLVLYGSLLCLSLFLQQARHQSVLATGLLLLPMSLVVGIGSLASGRLTARFGPLLPIMAGLALGAAGAAVLATAGPATSLAVIVGGSALLGLVSLAMPAMTAVVVGAAGPEHAGVAGGILNAARQSGGALGVALLGSLLGSGRALSLHLPLAVAAGGYLVALALAALAIRGRG